MDGLFKKRLQNIARIRRPRLARLSSQESSCRAILSLFKFFCRVQLIASRFSSCGSSRFFVAERDEGSSGPPLYNARRAYLVDGSTTCQADVGSAHCLRGCGRLRLLFQGICGRLIVAVRRERSAAIFSPERSKSRQRRGPCQADA